MQPGFSQTILLFSLLVSSLLVQAQSVLASQEITVANESRYELLSGSGDQVVLYRDEPGKVLLDAFGADMNLVWSRELALDKDKPTPVGALVSNGEVAVFYTYRKDRSNYLKLHRYSDRGNLSDSLTVAKLEDEFYTSGWNLISDEDSKYAVLWHQRDAETYLLMNVELATGRLLYKQILKIDFGSMLTRDVRNLSVDHKGAVYLWMQENNRRSRIEEHALQLIRIDVAGAVESVLLDLSDILIYDLELGFDILNDKVVLAGYYAEDPDEAAGMIALTLPYSLQGEMVVLQKKFRDELLKGIDLKSKLPNGIRDLDALDVFFRKDGTVIVIGEQRKETIRTVGSRSGYFGSSIKTDYLYEDIILTAINPAGESVWEQSLPKKQFSQDDGAAFSGYYVASSPSSLHLIYNDEVRSGGTVSDYTIKGNGIFERNSLMNTEYQDLWLRLEAGIQLDGRTIVIPSERRNRLKLVKIVF